MKDRIMPNTPKGRRLSVVALAGAVLTLIWSLADWAGLNVPEAVVSAITGLSMLYAGSFEVGK